MAQGRTPNPKAYVDAVDDYLSDYTQQFNHDAMRHTFLDNERFHLWADLLDRFRSLDGARVLSSGCGMGGSLLAYHDAGAASVTGVEVDPEYVAFATLRTGEVASAAVHQVQPDPPLPFADGAFDIIESMDVIEHVPDPAAYLADLVRVLAPGGVILVVTPNRLWPVEQHLDILGPPWLPVGLADALFGFAGRLPGMAEERRFKYAKLRGMRTQNMSLLGLRRLAVDLDLHLRLLRPSDTDAMFPVPLSGPRAERMLDQRLGRYLSATKTLPVLLQRR